MPVPMASSFAEGSIKDTVKQQLCEENSYSKCLEQNAFSFTQLLMDGDGWHGIEADAELTSTLPSVLPQSDFTINPSNGGDCASHMPPNTRDKSRKRKPPSKDLSCITATPPTKAVELNDKQSKRHKASERIKEDQLRADQSRSEERLKGEQSHSDNTENTTSKLGKENSKPKQDYIHVRARRGQATDSHSLAERVRREKISQRMKFLQDLVPGCNKVTGKAMMLDEIINYVQSLQRQVEFLSMKLAAVKPRLNLYTDTFLANEVPSLAGCQDANGLNELHNEPQHALTGWQTTSDGQMMASVELQCS